MDLFVLRRDCVAQGWPQEEQGATYRTLGYISHRVGMNTGECRCWFELCRDLGLTQRHAGHIIARLDDAERIAADGS